MKNVTFVSGRLGGGGSERVLTLVANQMRRDCYNVSIIAFGQMNREYDNECSVTILKYTNDFNQIAALRKEIRRQNPNVVIAFEYYVGMKTVLATRGLGIKVIVSERNDPHKLDSQPVKKILRNLLYGWADTIVCQTDDAKAYFSNRIQKRARVICNPVKNDLPLWSGEQSHTIINYCKLEKQKNLSLLIESFSLIKDRYPEWKLEIYGEGSEKQKLLELIDSKGLQDSVKIYPFAENIHEIAATKYMFVSSSDFEGISNSMLEAMAMGMPVICTDCPIGGARMVIHDKKNGCLTPIGDTEKLESCMRSLINDIEGTLKMANEAAKVRERYSLKKITKQWERVCEENKGEIIQP